MLVGVLESKDRRQRRCVECLHDNYISLRCYSHADIVGGHSKRRGPTVIELNAYVLYIIIIIARFICCLIWHNQHKHHALIAAGVQCTGVCEWTGLHIRMYVIVWKRAMTWLVVACNAINDVPRSVRAYFLQ